jgi:hypothetical protein
MFDVIVGFAVGEAACKENKIVNKYKLKQRFRCPQLYTRSCLYVCFERNTENIAEWEGCHLFLCLNYIKFPNALKEN